MVVRMHLLPPSRFRLLAVLALLAGVLAPSAARPQDGILPPGGQKSLKEEYDRAYSANKLINGDPTPFDPKKKEHTDALDVEARYATYRFTWPEVQVQDGKSGFPTIEGLHRSMESTLGNLAKKGNPKNVGPYFIARVIEHAKEVLEEKAGAKPIAKINVARLLARLAEHDEKDRYETADAVIARLGSPEAGQPTVANELASTLRWALNSKNDGVRYWALKGLNALLKLHGSAKAPLLTRDREQETAKALGDLIEAKVEFTPATPREELEGYRHLRLEAVRALAQFRSPALSDQVRPALALLKVVANDGLTPEALTEERYEAALGLARMKPDTEKNYQPDYAMYFIAQFVGDMAFQFQRSRLDGDKKQAELDKLADQLKLDALGRRALVEKFKTRPWKYLAAKLYDALTEMKGSSANDYVNQSVQECYDKVLRTMEDPGSDPRLDDRFRAGVKPPKAASLFKNDDKAVVKPK
jgi:hypothetical protein